MVNIYSVFLRLIHFARRIRQRFCGIFGCHHYTTSIMLLTGGVSWNNINGVAMPPNYFGGEIGKMSMPTKYC